MDIQLVTRAVSLVANLHLCRRDAALLRATLDYEVVVRDLVNLLLVKQRDWSIAALVLALVDRLGDLLVILVQVNPEGVLRCDAVVLVRGDVDVQIERLARLHREKP